MRRTRFDDAPCPIARTADLIGDWWTPMLLREAFLGRRRFDDFQRALSVSRAVLSQRLARLVANVLTFSRRERHTLEIEAQPCIPDQVVGKVVESFRPSLRRREIEVDWDAGAGARILTPTPSSRSTSSALVSSWATS